MKLRKTNEITLTIIFAALYAIGVIVLAPISFNIFQVRVADALLPLSIIFGWSSIIGITVGTIVANFFGGMGFIDIVGGATANFIATIVAWKIGNIRVKGSWIYAIGSQILTVTLIVGSYLSYLFGMPLFIGLFGILIGSFIAIGILGYLLLKAMSREAIIRTLQSHGFEIYKETTINS